MALEHAILVSLAERSASGYDLARRFDASIGHFWSASHQQIYKVLGRMEADKLVAADLIAQEGRPDKKVYAIDRMLKYSAHEDFAVFSVRDAPQTPAFEVNTQPRINEIVYALTH